MNLRVAAAGEATPDTEPERKRVRTGCRVGGGRRETERSTHGQDEGRVTPSGYPEPVSVEKLSDDLCVGVKGQSNSEIARTPRNAFRCSLGAYAAEVERPIGCEGFAAYQVLTNSECRGRDPGVRARVLGTRVRERNNSDHRLATPKSGAELKAITRCRKATARMLAWKQPFI